MSDVHTHMWMASCDDTIAATHGGKDRMQATKRAARVAHLDRQHQPVALRDPECGDCIAPLAANDEFPVVCVW